MGPRQSCRAPGREEVWELGPIARNRASEAWSCTDGLVVEARGGAGGAGAEHVLTAPRGHSLPCLEDLVPIGNMHSDTGSCQESPVQGRPSRPSADLLWQIPSEAKDLG